MVSVALNHMPAKPGQTRTTSVRVSEVLGPEDAATLLKGTQPLPRTHSEPLPSRLSDLSVPQDGVPTSMTVGRPEGHGSPAHGRVSTQFQEYDSIFMALQHRQGRLKPLPLNKSVPTTRLSPKSPRAPADPFQELLQRISCSAPTCEHKSLSASPEKARSSSVLDTKKTPPRKKTHRSAPETNSKGQFGKALEIHINQPHYKPLDKEQRIVVNSLRELLDSMPPGTSAVATMHVGHAGPLGDASKKPLSGSLWSNGRCVVWHPSAEGQSSVVLEEKQACQLKITTFSKGCLVNPHFIR